MLSITEPFLELKRFKLKKLSKNNIYLLNGGHFYITESNPTIFLIYKCLKFKLNRMYIL